MFSYPQDNSPELVLSPLSVSVCVSVCVSLRERERERERESECVVLVLALGLGFVLKLERTICFVGYINVRHVVVVFYFLFLFYLLKFYINSDLGKGKDEVRVGILIFF